MVTDGYCTYDDHFVIYLNVESLCWTPETNISQLYFSLKKKVKRKEILSNSWASSDYSENIFVQYRMCHCLNYLTRIKNVLNI